MAFNMEPLKDSTGEELCDSWKAWKREWDLHYILSDLNHEPEPVQCANFLLAIGQFGVSLMDFFRFEDDERDKLKPLIAKYQAYCDPPRNSVLERFKFNTRDKKPGESYDEYVYALRRLTEYCGYGTQRDDMIRDRLVCQVKDKDLFMDIMTEDNLDLARLLHLIRVHELCRQIAADRKQKEEEEGCPQCGVSRHRGPTCPAANVMCHNCQQTGHFARRCPNQ